MTTKRQRQQQTQVPCGNDKRKGKSKHTPCVRGVTSKKGKGESERTLPSGMASKSGCGGVSRLVVADEGVAGEASAAGVAEEGFGLPLR